MSRQRIMQDDSHRATGDDARRWLLAGAPVKERRLDWRACPPPCWRPVTAAGGAAARPGRLGGDVAAGGPGAGRRLPRGRTRPAGPGRIGGAGRPPDAALVLRWLGALIERTCQAPPVLVGASLGGSIAARFAITHPDRLSRLVLVDSGSLARFRPAPGLALAMIRFIARPDERSRDRVLRQVLVDPTRSRGGWASAGRLSRRTTSTLPARRACGPPTAGCFGSSERGRSRPSSSRASASPPP